MDQPRSDLLTHTARIVAAHLGGNTVEAQAVPDLIRSVYQALATVGSAAEPEAAPRAPAVAIRKSVFPDYIICLEDGAKMKMLKRYIQKRFNLTPAEYRAKWGLPSDYPMVAPNYSSHRSGLAKQLGLGRKAVSAPELEPEPEPEIVADAPEPAAKPARKRRTAKDGAKDKE